MKDVKVLVVEDEAIFSLLICKELQSMGFTVQNKIVSADDAITTAAEYEPDFILMDIRLMGTKDGIEAAEAINRHREKPIPIAFMTAYSNKETKDRALKANAVAYIIKPIDLQGIKELIESAIAT